MSATTIYLVIGSAGEYSDHRTWVVGAFYDDEQAKARITEIENEVARVREALGEDPRYFVDGADKKKISGYDDLNVETSLGSLDPHFQTDYTGTSYGVEPCDLFGAVDTFLTTREIVVRK